MSPITKYLAAEYCRIQADYEARSRALEPLEDVKVIANVFSAT